MTDYAPGYATRQEYYFDQSVGDQSWGDLTWSLVESKKLMRTDTQFGSYFIEILPDQKSYRLSFHFGGDVRICPTRFTATNRAQGEANDHHQRLVAQQDANPRMKPPKW